MAVEQTGCVFQVDIATVTSAGTAVQLSSAGEHVQRITFRGTEGNTGNVGIGNSDVSMSSATWILKPGESITLDFSPGSVLLSDFFVDADNNNDKLDWIVGATLLTGAGTQGAIAHSATTGKTSADHTPTITAMNNATADELVTVGATTTELEAEANIAFDGTTLTLLQGQIAFPATQVASAGANTLDDYEEGTFTPTLQDNTRSDAESVTYNTNGQVGAYTKIGDRILIQVTLSVNSIGSLTTSEGAVIAGLPFTNANIANNRPGMAVGSAESLAITAGQAVAARVIGNETVLRMSLWDAVTGTTILTVAEWSAGGQIELAGFYVV